MKTLSLNVVFIDNIIVFFLWNLNISLAPRVYQIPTKHYILIAKPIISSIKKTFPSTSY